MASFIDEFLGPASNQLSNPADDGKARSFIDEFLPRIEAPKVEIKNQKPSVPMSGVEENQIQVLQQQQEAAKKYDETGAISRATSGALGIAADYGKNVYKKAEENIRYGMEGIKEATQENKPLGIGKAPLGVLGAVVSPITAGIEEFVTKPVTKLTGSKETGERAGFIVGSGLPVAKATSTAVKSMPSNKAITAIVDTIGKDNIADVVAQLKSNPRLSIMDVAPANRQMAQKLITNEGPHQDKFEKWVRMREATAKDTVAKITENNLGVPTSLADKLDAMKANARAVGTKEIEPALAGTGQVNVTPVVQHIDDIIKPGVNSVISQGKSLPLTEIKQELKNVRDLLTDDKKQRTDPRDLHIIQSGLRSTADDLLNSSSGRDRQIGHALMKVRDEIVTAIDKASPKIKVKDKNGNDIETGSFKPALEKYRDEMQVQNAFNMGQLVTRNKLGRLEDTPEFWDKWVKAASKEELEAARDGARLAIYHQIKAFKSGARKTEDIAEVELNIEKLKSLFGEKEINNFQKFLRDEREIAVTNQKLIHNSETAKRMKADKRVDLPEEKRNLAGAIAAPLAEIAVATSTGVPGASIPILAAQGAAKLKHKFATRSAEARNERITDLLTATGPERDQLITILESHIPKPKPSMMQRIQNFSLPVLPP